MLKCQVRSEFWKTVDTDVDINTDFEIIRENTENSSLYTKEA
jgi:hypothetical protein